MTTTTATRMLWRGLCIIVPLLFVSVNCQPLDKSAGDGNLKNKGIAENIVSAETNYKGKWELFSPNSGVSAMHLILLPKTNNSLMFDSTIFKTSRLKFPDPHCQNVVIPNGPVEEHCFAHSVLMDFETAKVKPLKFKYDTWCSSGALDVKGRLVSTGGSDKGSDTVRILDKCDDCQWKEYPGTLGNGRWYSTQVTLGDGRFMVFGGRDFPTYEFVPSEGHRNSKNQVIDFKFLRETRDRVENNLYPFVNLHTDGNLFIFANNRSVLLNPKTNLIVHEFPVLPNGARSYPASGCSCMLPITLHPDEKRPVIPAEILVCGGAAHDAFTLTDLNRPKVFPPVTKDCGLIDISEMQKANWKILQMPSPRILGDAMVLPTGDVLLVNGAKSGSAGWDDARDPNMVPVLYNVASYNFKELNPSTIPRMYHSTSAVLPDGKILIAGSNTNDGYLDVALFPTETRVEKFSPHYFDPALDPFRTEILYEKAKRLNYGKPFKVRVRGGDQNLDMKKLQVNIYNPPFTTHGISMNQRMIRLGIYEVKKDGAEKDVSVISLQAPLNGNIAPPGYYMLFVVYNGVPCRRAMWVNVNK
ncbi:xyloglucan endotransglycosylase family protein [Hibiscus syriacus]|uniref:Xyloglucan endotransglycosylase family protein n=1 Tax=Hibiscus syriacus TaxID=106335 RepID=A0A6A2WH49_HIBSY|nr:aldehyde oxidase GLOX1-like [Hibiscus syriacus]KAE8658223.1 xyloglucan endotransglycosylase family protein [Hibiscus syriacus]